MQETSDGRLVDRLTFETPARLPRWTLNFTRGKCGCRLPLLSFGEDSRLCQPNADSGDVAPFIRWLDWLIVVANRAAFLGVVYKPYWILSDVAIVAVIGFAWAFSTRFPQVSCLALCAGALGALLAHKVVREAKAALGLIAARSFLQDCLLIIIPTFIVVSLALAQPLGLVIAFLGLVMPLYGGIVRIGCFLGGCCYGKHWRGGVSYPPALFASHNNGFRRYSPGPDPGRRVFPIQLVEAAAQLVLFASLARLLWAEPQASRYLLPLYLALYASIRFGLDFYRITSARPRYGRFSEAQLVCLGVLSFASLILACLYWS
jgi:phosphatidylglycerol---prolipoprotein diacylglyceryl transferase